MNGLFQSLTLHAYTSDKWIHWHFAWKINVLRAIALVPHGHAVLFNNVIHFLRRIDAFTATCASTACRASHVHLFWGSTGMKTFHSMVIRLFSIDMCVPLHDRCLQFTHKHTHTEHAGVLIRLRTCLLILTYCLTAWTCMAQSDVQYDVLPHTQRLLKLLNLLYK